MPDLRQLRIVVASPGDVQPERDGLDAVVDELNEGLAPATGCQLTLVRWETDTFPGFHVQGPQGLIDGIMRPSDCDILVGIFWKRFGTATYKAGSGTEHEFLGAYEAWKEAGRPHIMMYFKQAPYEPKNSEEAEQWVKVLEFKKNFPKEGLYWSYKDSIEFEKTVRLHLTRYLRHLTDGNSPPSLRGLASNTSHDVASRARDLLSQSKAMTASELALEALLLIQDSGHPALTWLEQEVSGYPNGEVENFDEVFPKYRMLTIHSSSVFPARLWLWGSLDQAITARPDVFVQQFVYYPRPLATVEADLTAGKESFYVLWMKSEEESAQGPHDASYVSYMRRHEMDQLIAGARQRIVSLLLSNYLRLA